MFLSRLSSILLIILLILSVAIGVNAQETPAIYLFYGEGCPHCAEVLNYFENKDLYSQYPVQRKEIYFNRDNALFYNQVLDKLKVAEKNRGVPTVVLGNIVLIGDRPILDRFVIEADKFLQENSGNVSQLNNLETEKEERGQSLNLTLAAVIGASIVDAINPCAFAVLIILMSTILATGNGSKALKTGIAFAVSIFISYFLMGLGLYKALGVGKISHLFFNAIGWLAIILGLLNLKDYFWYGKGFLMEVPISWRPKLKELIKSITSPLGAFGIGFLVSLILLPCTSGPYIVILGMLAKKALQTKAVFYLILYNLIFISPMVLISLAVYKGFDPNKAEKIRQMRLRTLHLVAGLIMFAMGIVVLMGWV